MDFFQFFIIKFISLSKQILEHTFQAKNWNIFDLPFLYNIDQTKSSVSLYHAGIKVPDILTK